MAVARNTSDLEETMKYVTRTLSIIIALIGLLLLLPAIPFIGAAGIFLVLAAGIASINKPKKTDADTQA